MNLLTTKPRPKTPGKQPKLPQPKPSVAQAKAMGATLQYASPLMAEAAPSLQLPKRPTLQSADSPTFTGAPIGMGTVALPGMPGPSLNQQYQAAQHGSIGVTPLSLQAAQTDARLAGVRDTNAYLSNALDTNPDVEGIQLRQPTPYVAPPMPQREQLSLPAQQAPQADPLSLLLSVIGGAIAPEAAGQFASAPLQSAQASSQQQWQDALNRYYAEQALADQRYGDALRGRSDQMGVDQYNLDIGRMAEDAQRAINLQLAPGMGQETELSTLSGALSRGRGGQPSLIEQDTAAQKSALDAQRIGGQINSLYADNAAKTTQYGAEVQGAVNAYEAQMKAHIDNLRLRAEMGDKQAQRLIQAYEAQSNDNYRRNQNAIGYGQLGVAQQNAATNRMNADTRRFEVQMKTLKDQMDRQNKPLSELVWKHPEIANLYSELRSSQARYNDIAIGNASKLGSDDRSKDVYVQRAEAEVRAKEQALDKRVKEIYNEYARQYGQPPLPLPSLGGAKSAAERNRMIQPGQTTLGGMRLGK